MRPGIVLLLAVAVASVADAERLPVDSHGGSLAGSTDPAPPVCGDDVRFATIRCRLVQLAEDVRAVAPSASVQRRLVRWLTVAGVALDAAAERTGPDRLLRLRRTGVGLTRFVRLLRAPEFAAIDVADRTRLAAVARALRRDLVVLART